MTTLPGPMVWAPLSEVPQIVRMPIYIITLAIFVVLQVPIALATNYGVPFPHRILRFPDYRNGWRDRRRSIHSEEACIRNDPLVYLLPPRQVSVHSSEVSQCVSRAGVGQSGSSCGSLLQLSSCYSSSTPRPPHPTSSTGAPTVSARLLETLRSCPPQRSV
jgi:hypothetical protein